MFLERDERTSAEQFWGAVACIILRAYLKKNSMFEFRMKSDALCRIPYNTGVERER